MKKIILASLLATCVATAAFAGGEPSLLSGACSALTAGDVASMTFSASSSTASTDVPAWLSKIGAQKVQQDAAGKMLHVAVKGCAKELYCEPVEEQHKNSAAKVVCAISQAVLEQKVKMVNAAVACYNDSHPTALGSNLHPM